MICFLWVIFKGLPAFICNTNFLQGHDLVIITIILATGKKIYISFAVFGSLQPPETHLIAGRPSALTHRMCWNVKVKIYIPCEA